jgi:hypothetical protein
MKPILKERRRGFRTVIAPAVFILAVVITTFFFALKYAGEKKKIFPELKLDHQVLAPVSAFQSGFYKNGFFVELRSPDPSARIFYTLDGSAPDLSSEEYLLPLQIQKKEGSGSLSLIPTSPRWKPPLSDIFMGTTLRAICVKNEIKKSDELVRTFFIDEKGAGRYSMPVVALTADPDDLFGYENGIYILGKKYASKKEYIREKAPMNLPWWNYPSNYKVRGKASDRNVFLEVLLPDGTCAEKGRVRINGNATRGFAQKSLRISFSENPLKCRLFGDSGATHFSSFILRNGGNDWDKTLFRDVLMQSLMKGSKLDLQSAAPCVVFINGEFWGIHTLCERQDENYLANKYGISKDSIAILEYEGRLSFGKKQDETAFAGLLSFVRTNDLSRKANYDSLRRAIDLESFMDFVISNVYFCNSDWPNNNVKFWRYRKDVFGKDTAGCRDGKWRWMLYDTDWGFGYTSKASVQDDLLDRAVRIGSVGVIFKGLLQNDDFVNLFRDRFHQRLKANFDPENVQRRIDEFVGLYGPEIQEHCERWRSIGSYDDWLRNVNELRDFANTRPAIQKEQLTNFLAKEKKETRP